MDQKITESHLPGQYPDIALVPGQYLDIALAAGQYKIYCPALAFDPPTQSVTYTYVTQAGVICLICMHGLGGRVEPQARGRVPTYRGKSRLHMLYMLCNTFITIVTILVRMNTISTYKFLMQYR